MLEVSEDEPEPAPQAGRGAESPGEPPPAPLTCRAAADSCRSIPSQPSARAPKPVDVGKDRASCISKKVAGLLSKDPTG